MAKITVNIDTEEQTMSVKMGNEVVEDATYFSVYAPAPDDKYGYLSVSLSKSEKTEDGIYKTITYSVMGSEETKKAIQAGKMFESKKYIGFAESLPISPVVNQVSEFLSGLSKFRKASK